MDLLPRITELTHESAQKLVADAGLPSFRSIQLWAWVMKRGVFDPAGMTDLPADFRARLNATYRCGPPIVLKREADDDTTTEKILLEVTPGDAVEAVLIMEGDRSTICLSTQVGCPVACVFCASGLFGLRRNLTRGEILEQYLTLDARARELGRKITNVVVMGMGEPMLNLGNVLGALATINDPAGPGLGARHITVSTIGIAKGVEKFTAEKRQYTLAFSLHAPNDTLRGRIVPFEGAMSERQIVAAARDYLEVKGREVTFEYVLLDGINDSIAHARELAELLRGVRGTVNVIPFNEVAEQPCKRPSEARIESFTGALVARGVRVTERKRKGHDIAAACGQLRLHNLPQV